jgi:hypothetical protein
MTPKVDADTTQLLAHMLVMNDNDNGDDDI